VTSRGYTSLAKALHWITSVLVFGALGVSLWMIGQPIGLLKLQVYGWHKWIGLTVLALTLLRLGWRWHAPPPPPGTVAHWERKAVPLGHAALLVPHDPLLLKLLRATHDALSRLLIVVVALHVVAVLRHDVFRRDGIFRRMWPFDR
jgi:cytochrome b561